MYYKTQLSIIYLLVQQEAHHTMKKLSFQLLAETVVSRRKALKLSQAQLAEKANMNRSMLSKLESQEYTPSIEQLQALAEVLGFEPTDLFMEETEPLPAPTRSYKIAVAGTGYVGLSLAVLLAQHNEVTAVDILPEKALVIKLPKRRKLLSDPVRRHIYLLKRHLDIYGIKEGEEY